MGQIIYIPRSGETIDSTFRGTLIDSWICEEKSYKVNDKISLPLKPVYGS